jgi:hypothetical protein
MKYRTIILFVQLGILSATQFARAGFPSPMPPEKRSPSFFGSGKPGIQWQTPKAAINPLSLIPPDDSAEASLPEGFTKHHFESFTAESFQLANAFKPGEVVESQTTKPIEKIEISEADFTPEPPATIAVPRHSETKRIAWIAIVSVGLLAFRKFRRTGPIPQKPSFL